MAFNAAVLKDPINLENDYEKKSTYLSSKRFFTPEYIRSSHNFAFTIFLGVWYVSYQQISTKVTLFKFQNRLMFNYISSFLFARFCYNQIKNRMMDYNIRD